MAIGFSIIFSTSTGTSMIKVTGFSTSTKTWVSTTIGTTF
jgi:hypothetical protein